MDHSIYGYLSRRSTAELHNILKLYCYKDVTAIEKDVIRITLEILRSRHGKLPPEYSEYWEQFADPPSK